MRKSNLRGICQEDIQYDSWEFQGSGCIVETCFWERARSKTSLHYNNPAREFGFRFRSGMKSDELFIACRRRGRKQGVFFRDHGGRE